MKKKAKRIPWAKLQAECKLLLPKLKLAHPIPALTWNEEGIELMRVAREFREHWLGHFYDSAKFDKDLAKLLLRQRVVGRNGAIDWKAKDVDVEGAK